MVPVSGASLRRIGVSLLCLLAGVLGGRLIATEPPPADHPTAPEAGSAAPLRSDDAPAPPAALPEAFSDLDPGPAPAGDGAIRGIVETEDGRPLSGVTVRARPDVPDDSLPPDGPPPPGDPLGPEVESEARWLIRTRRGTRETTSGADGTFLLTGIGDFEYRVSGYRPGFEVEAEASDGVRAGDSVRLVALPVVELRVRVLMPDGNPADHALLRIDATRRYVRANLRWSPDRPTVDLGPGPIRIRAEAGEDREFTSERVELELEAGVRPDPITLTLEARPGIRGKLVFPATDWRDHRSAGYRIVALRVRPDATPDPSRLLREFHHECRMHTYSPARGSGSFRLMDLKPGTWLVGVSRRRKEVFDSKVVEVSTGMATIDLSVPLPGAGEATTVRVLDPDGLPVSDRDNVQIRARHVAADGTESSGTQSEFLGEATWRVYTPPAPPGKEAGGRYLLRVRSRKCGWMTVEYDPARPGGTEVRFDAPAFLTVRIPDYATGRYRGRMRLRVDPGGSTADVWRPFPDEEKPDPDGTRTFGPLAPGEWEVRLAYDTGTFGTHPVLSVPVRLTSGEAEVRLDPPPLFELAVLAPGDGSSYRLEPVGEGRWRLGPPAEDGTVRFPGLLAGDYVLWRIDRTATEGMAIRLEGDRSLRFAAETLDALRVSVRDQTGALAAAGFLDGDRITAIAGTEIEDATHGRTLLYLHAEGGPVEVRVLRGGVTLTLSADPASIRSPKRAGGTLHPWPR